MSDCNFAGARIRESYHRYDLNGFRFALEAGPDVWMESSGDGALGLRWHPGQSFAEVAGGIVGLMNDDSEVGIVIGHPPNLDTAIPGGISALDYLGSLTNVDLLRVSRADATIVWDDTWFGLKPEMVIFTDAWETAGHLAGELGETEVAQAVPYLADFLRGGQL